LSRMPLLSYGAHSAYRIEGDVADFFGRVDGGSPAVPSASVNVSMSSRTRGGGFLALGMRMIQEPLLDRSRTGSGNLPGYEIAQWSPTPLSDFLLDSR
jgi:hypothetical protein